MYTYIYIYIYMTITEEYEIKQGDPTFDGIINIRQKDQIDELFDKLSNWHPRRSNINENMKTTYKISWYQTNI